LESRESSNIERQENNVIAAQREEQEIAPVSVAARQDTVRQNNVQTDAQRNQGAPNADTRANEELPATASGWLAYLLGGSFLIFLAGLCRKLAPQE
jgi:hypothetical protein